MSQYNMTGSFKHIHNTLFCNKYVSLQIQCVSSNPSTPPIHGFHYKPNVLNVDLGLIIKHIINGTYNSNSANKT